VHKARIYAKNAEKNAGIIVNVKDVEDAQGVVLVRIFVAMKLVLLAEIVVHVFMNVIV
jgi:uncharacterized protein (DUF2141 family)